MGRLLRGGTAWAMVLAAAALGHTADTTPVWRRHDSAISAVEYRVRYPGRRLNHEIGSLTEPEFRARALAIARDLEAHLRDPALTVHEKNVVLGILARLRDLAAPTAGTLAQVLHAYDQDRSMSIPYFCTVTRTMTAVAPRDPVVIRALANALAQEAGSGLCHRCGCALDALQAAGLVAAPIAGPVLEELARKPRFMTCNSDQLGKAIEAVGARDAMALALFERVRSAESAPDDRIATLRAVAKSYPNLSVENQARFADVAEGLLGSDQVVVRTAGAETLALSGPRALTALMRGLGDAHYTVRAASARSLARLGPAACGRGGGARPRRSSPCPPHDGSDRAGRAHGRSRARPRRPGPRLHARAK